MSAPSGTGKTTVVERLVQVVPDLALSRSYTSRPARPGESDGVDYNFITRSRFEEMIAGERVPGVGGGVRQPLRHERGGCGARAGAGRDLVLVIDVQGARQVRRRFADTVGIFVMPPSFAVLEQRLRGRSKDTGSRDAAAARRRHGTKSRRSPNTTTSSSTTSSRRASTVCAPSSSPSGRGLRSAPRTKPSGSAAHSAKGWKVIDRTQGPKRV